jgi:hypothetical protein
MMLFGGLFSCLGPLVLIALASESIRILWVTLVPPSRPRQAGCGRCDYPVAGLQNPTCPECGADLYAAGINTIPLAIRHRGSLPGAIIAWTVIMLGGGFIGTTLLGFAWSATQVATTASSTTQTWTTPLYPNSKSLSRIDLAQKVSWGGSGANAGSVKLTIVATGGTTWDVDLDGSTKTFTVHDSSGTEVVPATSWGAGSGKLLLKTAGLDTTDAKVAAEAAELENIVSLVLMAPFTQPSQMNLTELSAGTTKFSGGPMATAGPGMTLGQMVPYLIVPGLALLLWGFGLWGIAARRRALLRRGAPAARPDDPVFAP